MYSHGAFYLLTTFHAVIYRKSVASTHTFNRLLGRKEVFVSATKAGRLNRRVQLQLHDWCIGSRSTCLQLQTRRICASPVVMERQYGGKGGYEAGYARYDVSNGAMLHADRPADIAF